MFALVNHHSELEMNNCELSLNNQLDFKKFHKNMVLYHSVPIRKKHFCAELDSFQGSVDHFYATFEISSDQFIVVKHRGKTIVALT